MTPEEAIDRLNAWGVFAQNNSIGSGHRDFSDIACVIINAENVRAAALHQVATAIEQVERIHGGGLLLLFEAHRILANNNPKGEFTGESKDLESTPQL